MGAAQNFPSKFQTFFSLGGGGGERAVVAGKMYCFKQVGQFYV
jgi:hypothetical protein